jgi:membrane protein DedA with SNARE-associated domain
MNWLSTLLENLNYYTVFILMFIEGSVIPAPSELIVPPAAYRAAAGDLNVFLVVIVATLGALLGSTANYAAAYYLGRPIVYRFANSKLGHLCLLNQEKVEKAEKYFNDHGVTATLTGRLLPGIRQIISIPAGLSKMKFWKFAFYTTLGAGLWNCVLASLGWWLHSFVPMNQLDDKIEEYNGYIQGAVVGIVLLVVFIFAAKWYFSKKKSKYNADV